MKTTACRILALVGLASAVSPALARAQDDAMKPAADIAAAPYPDPFGAPAPPPVAAPVAVPAAAPASVPPVFVDRPKGAADVDAPEAHVVQKGESLWEICERRLGNPWVWPKVWSLNPSIKNPHLIEPGTKLRLSDGTMSVRAESKSMGAGQRYADRRAHATKGSVYVRNYAYVEDGEMGPQGTVVGSPDEHMFLGSGETVYVAWNSGELPKESETLSVYRTVRREGLGTVITLQAALKVRGVDEQKKLVRATIIETSDVLERGALVGPVRRGYDMVAPQVAAADVTAKLIAAASSHELLGVDQVVFMTAGRAEGVAVGNLARVVRRGDGYALTHPHALQRRRLMMTKEAPFDSEELTFPSDQSALPDESFADLRVLEVREHSSVLLVTRAQKELFDGDVLQIKSGR